MNANRSTRIALLAAAMSSLTLAGCVVAPAPNGYAYYDPVMVAPPPPRVEIVGVAPYPGHIWITGYWGWNGRAHHWVPGRWEAPRHLPDRTIHIRFQRSQPVSRVVVYYKGERMGEARPVDFVANDRKPSKRALENAPARQQDGEVQS